LKEEEKMEDNETLKSVRDQLYEVQHLNLDLCKSLDEVMDENVILQNDLDEVMDENDELETEVEDLQARIKDLETINSGLNDLVNNQEDDLLELENKYSELLNEIEANSKHVVCEDVNF
jgi:predicted nuclease with TOPRIM domain